VSAMAYVAAAIALEALILFGARLKGDAARQ
jgi:hypothetical protein